jgi:hypothetical protein
VVDLVDEVLELGGSDLVGEGKGGCADRELGLQRVAWDWEMRRVRTNVLGLLAPLGTSCGICCFLVADQRFEGKPRW